VDQLHHTQSGTGESEWKKKGLEIWLPRKWQALNGEEIKAALWHKSRLQALFGPESHDFVTLGSQLLR
jgi:hypothetical protein